MSNFLSERVAQIIAEQEDFLDEITVILPNRRAAVYVQHYFASQYKKPFFAPEIITINDWIQQNTPDQVLSTHELLFVLFEVHQRLNGNDDDFNEFIKWAKTLLGDFDEIDRYLIHPSSIFKDLRNIKEIEYWSFNDPTLTEGQQKYLHFWNELPVYYEELGKLLSLRNQTYSGKAYRWFAENCADLNLRRRHYYFLGFNALSASEQKIIHYLLREKRATFLTEIDEFYYLNAEHEAGHFYRDLVQRWQLKPNTSNHFNAVAKRIEVVECAHQTGQAKVAGEIIADLLRSGTDMNRTAVVLADESLLIPLTKELPLALERANITMGYPLKYTHLKSLIDLIFELQFNFQKFKNSKLYHKSLLRVLDHAYISALIQSPEKLIVLEEQILEHNQVFIDWTEIANHLPELTNIGQVFQLWQNPVADGLKGMNALVESLYHSFNTDPNKALELEMLYHFATSFERFEKIWMQYQHGMDLKSFKRMFYQFWQNETLSFFGNPIEGIQVMGILETRVLDFETLIILGLNEGNLPQVNTANSYIPFDLKKHHGLPVESDRQAIFAHHFYRLLHRASSVYMTYNSGGDDAGNSEKSRYLVQLENELNPSFGHSMSYKTFTPNDRGSRISPARYQSLAEVHERLDDYFINQGLSPSALNKLMNCPLDFYYRYILEMKENEQVEENIESSTFGTKIHDVLERIFRTNFLEKNEPLDALILRHEKNNLEKYLHEKYLESFTESEIKYGQNRLSFEVSLGFLEKFLDKQIEEIDRVNEPIYLVDLEKNLEQFLEIAIEGKAKKIRLIGKADRIDQIGKLKRIIDYKSGKCDDEKVVIIESHVQNNELQKLMDHTKKAYARQLLMYAAMYRASSGESQFSAGIISMININDWVQNVRVGKEGDPILTNQLLDRFEEELKRKIARLYEPDFYFEHNPDSHYCEHCEG